jgi:hypothetical protein
MAKLPKCKFRIGDLIWVTKKILLWENPFPTPRSLVGVAGDCWATVVEVKEGKDAHKVLRRYIRMIVHNPPPRAPKVGWCQDTLEYKKSKPETAISQG